jgi:hypothetical protein
MVIAELAVKAWRNRSRLAELLAARLARRASYRYGATRVTGRRKVDICKVYAISFCR